MDRECWLKKDETYCYSLYVKAGERHMSSIKLNTCQALFNLRTADVVSSKNCEAGIEVCSIEWYSNIAWLQRFLLLLATSTTLSWELSSTWYFRKLLTSFLCWEFRLRLRFQKFLLWGLKKLKLVKERPEWCRVWVSWKQPNDVALVEPPPPVKGVWVWAPMLEKNMRN